MTRVRVATRTPKLLFGLDKIGVMVVVAVVAALVHCVPEVVRFDLFAVGFGCFEDEMSLAKQLAHFADKCCSILQSRDDPDWLKFGQGSIANCHPSHHQSPTPSECALVSVVGVPGVRYGCFL